MTNELTWYPDARRNEAPVDGGSWVPSPWRGVMHTTEGSSFTPGTKYFGHNSWPHFTVEKNGTVWQHIPLTRAARALQNAPGGVQTNRAHAVQIEVVGHADKPDWPAVQLAAVRRLVGWINAGTGIPHVSLPAGKIPGSARVNAPQRLSHPAWMAFNGWCGHRHVPENDHWDPGSFDLNLLFEGAPPLETTPLVATTTELQSLPAEEEDMAISDEDLEKIKNIAQLGAHEAVIGILRASEFQLSQQALDERIRAIVREELRAGQPIPQP